jgi:hypothetical protein
MSDKKPISPSVPINWVMVPVQPTDRMMDAGIWKHCIDSFVSDDSVRWEIWNRMVMSAPEMTDIFVREELERLGYDVPKNAVGWQQAYDGPRAKWWLMGVRGMTCSTWSAPEILPWNGGPRFVPVVDRKGVA